MLRYFINSEEETPRNLRFLPMIPRSLSCVLLPVRLGALPALASESSDPEPSRFGFGAGSHRSPERRRGSGRRQWTGIPVYKGSLEGRATRWILSSFYSKLPSVLVSSPSFTGLPFFLFSQLFLLSPFYSQFLFLSFFLNVILKRTFPTLSERFFSQGCFFLFLSIQRP